MKSIAAAGAFFALAVCLSPLYAGGDPLEYTVYLKKLELKNNTGEWVTVVEPDRAINLTEQEARVSFFNTAGRVPDGNYINFRITLSESITFQGRDRFNTTKAGGKVELEGEAVTPADLPEKATVFREIAPSWKERGLPGTLKVTYFFNPEAGRDDAITFTRKTDFPEAFPVRKGSFIYALVLIDLDGSVQHAERHQFGADLPSGDAMFAWPIRNIVEAKLTIGERSTFMGPDEILIEY